MLCRGKHAHAHRNRLGFYSCVSCVHMLRCIVNQVLVLSDLIDCALTPSLYPELVTNQRSQVERSGPSPQLDHVNLSPQLSHRLELTSTGESHLQITLPVKIKSGVEPLLLHKQTTIVRPASVGSTSVFILAILIIAPTERDSRGNSKDSSLVHLSLVCPSLVFPSPVATPLG